MRAQAKAPYDFRTDERLLKVARETGYPVDQVYSRGVKFCRDNPRGKGGDFHFDQSAPDFEPVRRVDLEDSETPADVLAQTRTPEGFVDRERDAQLLPTTRAFDGTPTYLSDTNTHAAQVVAGVKASCSMPRISVRGGVAFSLRLNGVEFERSVVLSDEEADRREPFYRASLYAYAAAQG